MTRDVDRIAERYMEAMQSADQTLLESVLAPGFTLWHNTDGRSLDLNQALGYMQMLGTKVRDVVLTDLNRVVTDAGYVEESTVKTTTTSGAETIVYACFVVRLDSEERVLSVREYVDSASFDVILNG